MTELGSSFSLAYYLAFNNHKEDLHVYIGGWRRGETPRYRNTFKKSQNNILGLKKCMQYNEILLHIHWDSYNKKDR